MTKRRRELLSSGIASNESVHNLQRRRRDVSGNDRAVPVPVLTCVRMCVVAQNVGIAAEHGCFYRSSSQAAWKHALGEGMMTDVAAWKSVALPILESYSEATDGSFVQVRRTSLEPPP